MPKDLPIHGRSLVPLLKGQTPVDWNQNLLAEYHMIHYAEANMTCYRSPQYKLIRDSHNEGRDEFYDLLADRNENQNLINDKRPHIAQAIADLTEKIRLAVENL